MSFCVLHLSLGESVSHHSQQTGKAATPRGHFTSLTTAVLWMSCSYLGFYVGLGDLNPGPLACTTSTLSTEPSPQASPVPTCACRPPVSSGLHLAHLALLDHLSVCPHCCCSLSSSVSLALIPLSPALPACLWLCPGCFFTLPLYTHTQPVPSPTSFDPE